MSTNRIVHKPLRRSGDGINLVGDVDVAITSNTGKGETSSSRVASRRRSFSAPGRRPSGPEMMATRIQGEARSGR